MSSKSRFGNLQETRMYVDNLKLLQDPDNPKGNVSYYPRLSSTFTLSQAQSVYLPPSSNSGLTSLTTNNAVLDFDIGSDLAVNSIDWARLDITLLNSSGVTAYLAPGLGIFESVALFSQGSNSPFWLESGPVHLSQFMIRERDVLINILSQEGHQTMTNESFSSVVNTVANTTYVDSDTPALYPGKSIPAGGSITISYNVLGSPLTQPGYTNLAMGPKTTIRFRFANGLQWISAGGNAVTVSDSRLMLQGVTFPDGEKDAIVQRINSGRSLTVPFLSPVYRTHQEQSTYTAGIMNDITLNEFLGSYAGVFFYLNNNAPLASSTAASFVGASAFVQDVAPQTQTVDLTAGTSTIVAASYGANYRMNNLTFFRDGATTLYSPDLTTAQLEDFSFNMACSGKSYLLPTFKSYYFLPFSTNFRIDMLGAVSSGGGQRFRTNARIRFSTAANLTNTALYVVGFRHSFLKIQGQTIEVGDAFLDSE